MKKFYILLFAILTIANVYPIGKNPGASTDSSYAWPPGNINLPKYFYKRFEGTINNNLNIVMNLIRIDTLLTGDYYYETTGMPVFFNSNSRINNDGTIYIGEDSNQPDSNSMPVLSGEIKGKFVNEHTIMGAWQMHNAQDANYFNLVEKYPDGSVNLDIKEFGKKYICNDSKTADINFSLVQINDYKDKSIEDSINCNIVKSFINMYSPGESIGKLKNPEDVITDFINRYKEFINDTSLPPEYKQSWKDSDQTDVLFNSNNILAEECTEFSFEGGAHPLIVYNYSNYNLRTGKKITLDDIFRPGYKATLDKIGERKFKEARKIKLNEDLKNSGYLTGRDKFHLNFNFAISRLGLLFKFNEYEMGPYILGAPEVFISYTDLRYLMKPGNILEQFLK